MTVARKTFLYDKAWNLVRAFIALLTFIAAIMEIFLASDTLSELFGASEQSRLWAFLLLPIPVWFVNQLVVAGLIQTALRALGLLDSITVDSEGVTLRLRKGSQQMAWRDVRRVSTARDVIDIQPSAVRHDAAAQAALPIARAGAALSSGNWTATLTASDGRTLAIEGRRFLRPLDAEKRFRALLADALGVKLDNLEGAREVEVSDA